MPSEFFGLPIHPLIVHATVVVVPLAAVLVLLAVLLPRFRAWAGVLPAATSLLALVLTPLSTSSGENLEHQVGDSDLLEAHAELGEQLLPFTVALFVFAAGLWWLDRRRTRTGGSRSGRSVVLAVSVLAVLASVGTGVQVARIGHSGAEAAWSDVGSSTSGE